MNQITAPMAALFWVDTEDAGKTKLAVATRWSVGGECSLEMSPGVYAIFEPLQGNVSSTAFARLEDYDNGAYHISLFNRIQDQAAGPTLCLGDVLVQPTETKQAHLSGFFRLLAKESARLGLGRKWFLSGRNADRGEEDPQGTTA